jgi:hypothetical protein
MMVKSAKNGWLLRSLWCDRSITYHHPLLPPYQMSEEREEERKREREGGREVTTNNRTDN